MTKKIDLILIKKNSNKPNEAWTLTLTDEKASFSNARGELFVILKKRESSQNIIIKSHLLTQMHISVSHNNEKYIFVSDQGNEMKYLLKWFFKKSMDDFIIERTALGIGLILWGIFSCLLINSPMLWVAYLPICYVFLGLVNIVVRRTFMLLVNAAILIPLGLVFVISLAMGYQSLPSPLPLLIGLFEATRYGMYRQIRNTEEYKTRRLLKHSIWGIISFVLVFISSILNWTYLRMASLAINDAVRRDIFPQMHVLTRINLYIVATCIFTSILGKLGKKGNLAFANLSFLYASVYLAIRIAMYCYWLWNVK